MLEVFRKRQSKGLYFLGGAGWFKEGFIYYISSLKCILMASIWFKALKMIDDRSKVLQGHNATIDFEVKKKDGLIRDFQNLIKSEMASNSKRMQRCGESFEN